MTLPGVPQLAAVIIGGLACATDVTHRRIPNTLTLTGAVGALIFFLVTAGSHGLAWAAGGWVVGLAMFLPFFLLGGLGGGDVKLVAALGAWLGPLNAVWLALYVALAGGPMAVVLALSRGYLKRAFANLWGLFGYWRLAGVRPHPGLTLEAPEASVPRLPYAIPIAVGLGLTLWLR